MPDNIEALIPRSNSSNTNAVKKDIPNRKPEPVVKTPAKVKKHLLVSNTDYVGIAKDVWNKVIRPQAINIIIRSVTQALNNLFNGNGNSAPVQVDSTTHTSYDSIFNKGRSYEYIPAGRVNNNLGYKDIRYETWEDAQEVINSLCGLINANGYATIGDLYSLSGLPFDYTKNYYGWKNLNGVRTLEIKQANGETKYAIDFPSVEPITRTYR